MRHQVPKAFQDLYRPHRYKCYYGGRGGAKSTAFADALLYQADEQPLRVLCTREKQNSIKDSVHALLKERIADGNYTGFTITETEIRHVNGSVFIFKGLWQNIDSIKSMQAIDRCWIEEADTVSENSWRKLIPTIRKDGSEIWISFNPSLESDPVYQRFVLSPPPNAFVKKVSWRDNPYFTQVLHDEMTNDFAKDEEEAEHVWEGELKQFGEGSIYEKQLRAARKDGRICKIPLERTIPVNTFWDLGRNDTTAIWFHQRVGHENRFIYAYEHRLVGLSHYINYLKDWARERDITYDTHYLPHDVEVKELSTNKSRRETLELGGVKPIQVVPRVQDVNEGIEQTRRSFDSCYFDEEGCKDGLKALANYLYAFDEKYNVYRKTPLHNWASNYADAFRQFGQGFNPDYGWAGHMKKEKKTTGYTRQKRDSHNPTSMVV